MTIHAQLASTIQYLRTAPDPDHRVAVPDGSVCPHCDATHVQNWGGFSGRQRYRCCGCGRTFSTFTDTPLYHLKHPERWPRFLGCADRRLTVRVSGLVLDIDKDTALRWRHRLLGHWRREPRPPLERRLVIGDFCLPHSDKGGRYLQRPPRRRGEPWGFPSIQTGPVTVLVALERRTTSGDRPAMVIESVGVRRVRPKDYDRRIAPRIHDVSEIVGCRGPACPLAGFARRLGARYRPEIRSFFPSEVFLVRQGVRTWLRPFRGVATRRLDNYLEWFRRRGFSRSPQQFPPTEPYGARTTPQSMPPRGGKWSRGGARRSRSRSNIDLNGLRPSRAVPRARPPPSGPARTPRPRGWRRRSAWP